MSIDTDDFEALERAVAEIEVLGSIYGGDVDGDELLTGTQSAFRVISMDALDKAKEILVRGEDWARETGALIPTIDSTLHIPLSAPENNNETLAVMRIAMSQGYPMREAAVVSVEVPNLTRSAQDNLSQRLRRTAVDLLGEEAILGIVQEFQQLGSVALEDFLDNENDLGPNEQAINDNGTRTVPPFSRQWLFMDHIKAESRRAQMIQKATELDVGGLIKPGYPGVCVVEGNSANVEEFSSWMKQIWIGRVAMRGEVTIDDPQASLGSFRQLPNPLHDLGDGKNLPNMGVLGSACRENGLEDEFLQYIMRIKGS